MGEFKKRVSTTLDYVDFNDLRTICETYYCVPMAKVIRMLIEKEIYKYYGETGGRKNDR